MLSGQVLPGLVVLALPFVQLRLVSSAILTRMVVAQEQVEVAER